MVLPLYLALTAAEFSSDLPVSFPCAYMACHFSPYTEGISNIPETLPEGSILILNDRMPCQGHSADLAVHQLNEAVSRLKSKSVLLDFQRPPEPESLAIAERIIASLSCPVAATEWYAACSNCPIFLSPGPLHQPIDTYLAPWKGREIWLEAALCHEEVLITEAGMTHRSVFPTEQLSDGFYDKDLRCCYQSKIDNDSIRFTLFDTPESLEKKLEAAASLGVTRAVGLWQELNPLRTTQKPLTLR